MPRTSTRLVTPLDICDSCYTELSILFDTKILALRGKTTRLPKAATAENKNQSAFEAHPVRVLHITGSTVLPMPQLSVPVLIYVLMRIPRPAGAGLPDFYPAMQLALWIYPPGYQFMVATQAVNTWESALSSVAGLS